MASLAQIKAREKYILTKMQDHLNARAAQEVRLIIDAVVLSPTDQNLADAVTKSNRVHEERVAVNRAIDHLTRLEPIPHVQEELASFISKNFSS